MPLEANLFYGASSSSPSPSSKRQHRKDAGSMTGLSSAPSTAVVSLHEPSISSSSYTPSPHHTSRIPPPPSSSPSTSSSSASTSSGTRRRRSAAASSSSTQIRRQRSTGSSTSSPSKIAPGSFKLHFQGRVYRPFAHTSPPSARRLYSPAEQLLGQPDELVHDKEATIECPCKNNIDDASLMVQCDECAVWVHARCVGFETEDDCPELYRCRKCGPAFAAARRAVAEKEEAAAAREREYTTTTTTTRTRREMTPPPSISRMNAATAASSHPSSSPPPSRNSDSEDGGLEVEQPSPLTAGGGLTSSPLSRTPTRRHGKSTSNHSPHSPSSQHSVSRNLLSDFASASPSIKAGPLHPLLTPSKKRKYQVDNDKDESLVGGISTPSSSTESRAHTGAHIALLDPNTVPLPDHYTSLLNLHSALERALLLHLATEGSKACSAVTASSTTDAPNGGGNATEEYLVVDLPNLATFNGIRAVVERGANKRFGPTELAQLVWLWEGGLAGPLASEDSKPQRQCGGLSMSVSASREMDRASGKKVYTWGIGIRLELKENAPLPALEVVDNTASTSPAASTSSTASPLSGKLKRYGLSVLPLWSSKGESRKQEMRRRLGECVLKAHENFSGGSEGASRSKQACSTKDNYLLPTPPPSTRKTRVNESGSQAKSKYGFVKGFILDALPPIPAATLPALGPASAKSLSAPTLAGSQQSGTADADMLDVVKAEKVAQQPTTRDLSHRAAHRIQDEQNRNTLLDGAKSALPKAPAEQRAMSLLDRIKAKEAAAQAVKQASEASSPGINGSASESGQRSSKDPRIVARMSFEAASARAAKRKSAANSAWAL